jgi:hypothetical protein
MFNDLLLCMNSILRLLLLNKPLWETVSSLISHNIQRWNQILRQVLNRSHRIIPISTPNSYFWVEPMNCIGILLGNLDQNLLIDHPRHNIILWVAISRDQPLQRFSFLLQTFSLPSHFLIDSFSLLD